METPSLPKDLAGRKAKQAVPPSSGAQQPGNPTTSPDDSGWISIPYDSDEHGFRRIVRNFAPSYVSPALYAILYTKIICALIKCGADGS